MKRWIWKRTAIALVAAAGMVATADAQNKLSGVTDKDTDIIVLKFEGQPDRKVKVVKTTKQPDGTTATEVKDVVTGETFTLMDVAPDKSKGNSGTAPTPPPPPAKETGLPKAKPRTTDPLTPEPLKLPAASVTKSPTMPPTAAKPAMPVTMPTPDPEPVRRPGPLARLFGKKSPPPAAMPTPPAPSPVPATPPVPVSTRAPSLPGASALPGEPPRAMPPKAVTPPSPVIPAPLPIPTLPPNAGGPQSKAGAVQVILPVGYVPAEVALSSDIQPYVNTLRTALPPSARMTAVKALSGGRHASTNQVKGILFQVAKTDLCPEVQACAIEELTKLGYFTPEFTAHVKAASEHENDDVRAAARAAVAKLTPRK